MFVRKNYYLYAENAEKQNEKKKLLGSVRLTRIEEQWTMEIQWKDEKEASALVSKAEEEELQLQIKKKEDKQEREEQQRKLQIRTGGEDRGHQIDQEWEQIRSSCHKVEDCRELGEVYRVNKGNFAVLPESMKHILQNSFLVHGLMNYGYVLLFRVDEKARQFGVGVPGVYYEKEKLVAEMFGFPQFWCDGRSDNGKFGYYLRIVS